MAVFVAIVKHHRPVSDVAVGIVNEFAAIDRQAQRVNKTNLFEFMACIANYIPYKIYDWIYFSMPHSHIDYVSERCL